mmetsp:Transcript_99774/g.137238  ORF Transcript_99774/g.137238 Transcript_99774/m.137238 type:complete len:739 (+) Transcript_99774:105-2321(+)
MRSCPAAAAGRSRSFLQFGVAVAGAAAGAADDAALQAAGVAAALRGAHRHAAEAARDARQQQRHEREDEGDRGLGLRLMLDNGGGHRPRRAPQGGDVVLEDGALVVVVGEALAADDARGHALVVVGVRLEGEGDHPGRVGDRRRRGEALGLHAVAGQGEAELRAQAVAVVQDDVDEGLESGRALRVRRGLVPLRVDVAHQDDGPGGVPGHVVEVDGAPVRRRVLREDAVLHGLRARGRHAAERDRLQRRARLPGGVGQRHLGKAEVVPVAGVEVPDRVRVVIDERLHAWGALQGVELLRDWPTDRRRGAQCPVAAARGGQVAGEAARAAGAKGAVSDVDLRASRNAQPAVLRQHVSMVPGGDRAAEDLGQEASVHLQVSTAHCRRRNAVEDADGTQRKWQVHHRLRGRQRLQCREAASRHGKVAGAEVVVAHEAATSVPHKLFLTGAAANCTIGEVERHPGPRLHQLHGLGKPVLRIRGAAAMQRHDAVVIKRALKRCNLRRQGRHCKVELTQLPQRVRGPLDGDDVLAHACPGRRSGQERVVSPCGRLVDVVPRAAPAVHGGRELVEGVARQKVLTLSARNHVKEGLDEANLLAVHTAHVLVQVHVGHEDNGPGVGAGLHIEVHVGPVCPRIRGDGAACHRRRTGSCHTIVAVAINCAQGHQRGQPGVRLVLEHDLLEVATVPVTSVQVADGIRRAHDEVLHAIRALNRHEVAGGWPGDARTRPASPAARALGLHVT